MWCQNHGKNTRTRVVFTDGSPACDLFHTPFVAKQLEKNHISTQTRNIQKQDFVSSRSRVHATRFGQDGEFFRSPMAHSEVYTREVIIQKIAFHDSAVELTHTRILHRSSYHGIKQTPVSRENRTLMKHTANARHNQRTRGSATLILHEA